MFWRGIVFLLGCAVLPAHAGIYKCTGENGQVAFSDRPCRSGAQQKIELRRTAPTPAAEGGGELSAQALVGAWCEYAVSLTIDGEKDSSDPATWTFNTDGSMTYQSRHIRMLRGRYSFDGEVIDVDNGMIGAWRIHRVTGTGMVLESPLAGYGHWRRGGC